MGNISKARERQGSGRKRDAVVKTATRLFLKHGYTHTSMDAIAEGAGVSKQTVYSYFSNKEQLFRQMIEELCNAHTPSERLLQDPKLHPLEALQRIGQGFMDAIASPTGLGVYRLVMAESIRHPRIAEMFFQSGPQKMQALLVHYLERQVETGTLLIKNPDRAAGHFFAMLKSWYQLRLVLKLKPTPSKRELSEHVRDTVQAFCKGYCA